MCAKSCLVLPSRGDKVLLSISEERSWILAVLEGQTEATVVSLPADSVIASSGRLGVEARAGLVLASDEGLVVDAPKGTMRLGELSLMSNKLSGYVVEARIVADVLDSTVGRLVSRAKRVFRLVEELEQLRARQIDYSAEGALALRSDTAVVTADKVVRVDAGQIVMG